MAVPLDVESLLAEAMHNTGLSDFGPEDVWRDGLGVLARSLDSEARLTLLGRVLGWFVGRSFAASLRADSSDKAETEVGA